MLGSEMLRGPLGEPDSGNLPLVPRLLAQQILVVLIVSLKAVPKRFGIDASHVIRIA